MYFLGRERELKNNAIDLIRHFRDDVAELFYNKNKLYIVSVSEVETLFELFKRISSSVVDDGLISKEEFLLALFKNKRKKNLFANKIFSLFDVKHKGVVDFGDFVRSLYMFHPKAPVEDKIKFSLYIYI
uniref:Calcineurin B-like protein n=1 Tax=Lactuca sativa TaxID=4236 RepID=A0A9R1W0P2_LACSA|nr:hypothetical protein LSAT_V11C300145350 [Lactuca sativa]